MHCCNPPKDIRVADERPEEVDSVHADMPCRWRLHHRRIIPLIKAYQDPVPADAALLQSPQHSAQHTGTHLFHEQCALSPVSWCEV